MREPPSLTRSEYAEQGWDAGKGGVLAQKALGRSPRKVFSRPNRHHIRHATVPTAQTGLEVRRIGPSDNRMRHSRPLAEAHPELLVIDTPGLSREYRVENWHWSRDRRRRVINGFSWISWVEVFSVVVVALLWSLVGSLSCIPSQLIHNSD